MDIFGLSAIDRLFCFMIVRELQIFLRYLQRGLLRTPEFVKLVKEMIQTLEGPEKLLCKYQVESNIDRSNKHIWWGQTS